MAAPPPPPTRMSNQPRASKISVLPPPPKPKPAPTPAPAPAVTTTAPTIPIKPTVLSPKGAASGTASGTAPPAPNAKPAIGGPTKSPPHVPGPKTFGTAPASMAERERMDFKSPSPAVSTANAGGLGGTSAVISATQPPVRSKRGGSTSVDPRPKVEAKLSFAEHLPHKFEVETFSAELKKAVAYERPKVSRETDQMHSSWNGWLKFFDKMEQIAQIHSELAQDMTMSVVEPLNQFHEIGLDQGKESEQQVSKLEKELSATRVSVGKTRLKLSKELQQLQTLKESIEGGGSDGPGGGGSSATGGGKLMASVSGLFKGSTEQNLDKLRAKALLTANQYQAELEIANRQRTDITKSALPKIMLQMQSLEEMRLHSLNSALQAFVSLQDGVTEQFEGVSKGIRELYSNIHADRDIVQFVEECLSLHGPAADFKPFEYDLSITPDDLAPANFSTKASLFNTTFEGVMRYQKRALAPGANDPFDVPRIIPALIAAIEREGGCQSEGIFRISASVDDLHILKKQLEAGNYEVKCNSPHIPAALLKTWLRDSAEPLIPFASYGDCIAIGRDLATNGAGGAGNDSGAAPPPPALVRIMDGLPPLNKRIITLLVVLMRKISNEENYPQTRMGPTNLAIVFAPSFLKDKSDDPLTMLQDTKFACAFMTALIQHWDISGAPPSSNGSGSGGGMVVSNNSAAGLAAISSAAAPASPVGGSMSGGGGVSRPMPSGPSSAPSVGSPLSPSGAGSSGATFGLASTFVSGPMNVTTTANLASAKPISRPAVPTKPTSAAAAGVTPPPKPTVPRTHTQH